MFEVSKNEKLMANISLSSIVIGQLLKEIECNLNDSNVETRNSTVRNQNYYLGIILNIFQISIYALQNIFIYHLIFFVFRNTSKVQGKS